MSCLVHSMPVLPSRVLSAHNLIGKLKFDLQTCKPLNFQMCLFPVLKISLGFVCLQVDAAAVRARSEEALALKSRYLESRQKSKNMREAMREQKQRSRQLIVACAKKMQDQESEIERVSWDG